MTANTLAELSQYIGNCGVVSGQCIGQRRVGTYSAFGWELEPFTTFGLFRAMALGSVEYNEKM